MINILLKSSFFDFYSLNTEPEPCNSKYLIAPSNFYIKNCFFKTISCFSSNERVIYFNEISSNCLIEESIFSECCGNGYGGAIYYSCLNYQNNIILNKVCGNSCFSSSTTLHYGQFSFIKTQTNSKNYFLESTILKCSTNHNNNRYVSTTMFQGHQIIQSINLSQNYNQRVIHWSQSCNLTFKYNNIVNNTINEQQGNRFENVIGLIEKSNIIFNKVPSYGVLYILTTSINFKEIHLINNSENLIYIHNASPIFTNCFINHFFDFGISMTNYFTGFFTLKILNLQTFLCEGEINFPKTPIINVKNWKILLLMNNFFF